MAGDIEQQRDIGKAFREIADLRGDVKELRVALVGINGDNGLRGELRAFINKFDTGYAVRLSAAEDRIEEGIAEGKRLWEVERHKPGACIGKAALDVYIEEVKMQKEENERAITEMKKARITMITAIVVALIYAAASLFKGA